jgi:hypothetical protein
MTLRRMVVQYMRRVLQLVNVVYRPGPKKRRTDGSQKESLAPARDTVMVGQKQMQTSKYQLFYEFIMTKHFSFIHGRIYLTGIYRDSSKIV